VKILVVDTGSKYNSFGGPQRVAALLYKGLAENNEVYYLGYPTDYIKESDKGNSLFLSKISNEPKYAGIPDKSNGQGAKLIYNMIFKQMMVGIDRSAVAISVSAIMPDLIISNSIADFTLLSYLRKRGIKFKSVYIDHISLSTTTTKFLSRESLPLTVGSGINSITLDGAKKRFFNFFDMNVALNKQQETEILRFTDRVTRISNGIKMNTKAKQTELASVRKRYSISSTDFVVLYIGRLYERQKRVSTIINAFKSIKGEKMKLLLVGSGPSLEEYKELAGKDKRIVFCGPVSGKRVNEVYLISDLFVLASAWEGLTLTTLEALQFGLPVILSDDSYQDDLNVSDAPLLHFPTGDQEELASLMQSVMKDAKVRQRAIIASKILSKDFSEEKMLNKYQELIESL